MSKDVKDFSHLLFAPDQTQFQQLAEGMEIDPTALLRRLHDITITGQNLTIDEHKVIVTVFGTMGKRNDTGTGAEDLTNLHGREYGNAIKAAETVAKRRLTTNLLGYGYKHSLEETANSSFAAVEPQPLDTPGPVNNAPAAIVTDTREIVVTPLTSPQTFVAPVMGQPIPGPVLIVEPEKVVIPEFKLPAVPKVSEQTLAAMHTAAQTETFLDHDAAGEPVEVPLKKPAPPMSAQAGFFDDPTPPGEAAPPQPPPIQTSPIQEVAQASAAPWTPTPSDPIPSAAEPVPIQDIKVEPVSSAAPTQQEYRAIQVRCTKLVRDVLPKAGKGADALLVPYMRKRLGTNDLQKGSRLVWEETLAQLEAFPSAKDLAQFLNGGKPFNGK